ncbi:hypothetical protein BQ8794_150016 [Mesorhizobium prunaredense]|uniref:Uncharacterized protein n=1 Tax=Mesorhizobium prunaredense TaxID=1631249 RepID=A0A1R3V361_9HYPH|nr:hypothetical protein BQ8794_150016 [Mesorhizobium prunaredense]
MRHLFVAVRGLSGAGRGGISQRCASGGGDEPDTMSQRIHATGTKGRPRLYVPFTILGFIGRRD